jgi:hypothetical protein
MVLGGAVVQVIVLASAPVVAAATSADWKTSLRASGLISAASTSTVSPNAPNSIAAWKIAERQPGYAAQVSTTVEPASTAAKLAKEQALWTQNPARFDALHPRLGALFLEAKELAAGVPASSLHGLLPNTPFFNYYRWRRSLDPARFDFYHPNLGPLLAEDQKVRKQANSQPETVLPPPAGGSSGGGTPPGNNGGGGGVTPAVPEPAAVSLFLIGAGLVLAEAVRRKLLSRASGAETAGSGDLSPALDSPARS